MLHFDMLHFSGNLYPVTSSLKYNPMSLVTSHKNEKMDLANFWICKYNSKFPMYTHVYSREYCAHGQFVHVKYAFIRRKQSTKFSIQDCSFYVKFYIFGTGGNSSPKGPRGKIIVRKIIILLTILMWAKSITL